MWDGATVFIIGGGTSLESFDWSRLYDRHCIGCNDAYMLGAWVEICYFGDWRWYDIHKDKGLMEYKGLRVTCAEHPIVDPKILNLNRRPVGIYEAPLIGWNYSTGGSAINLAIQLGAKNIILLGFDMKLGKSGEANWHPNLKNGPNPTVYERFMEGMRTIDIVRKKKFSHVNIFNVNDDSDLDVFPFLTLEEALVL